MGHNWDIGEVRLGEMVCGSVDIHFDCSQGSACNIKIALCEKSVTVFELNKSN